MPRQQSAPIREPRDGAHLDNFREDRGAAPDLQVMELKPGDDMTHFGYEAREYFVSGTANEQPILGDASAVEF